MGYRPAICRCLVEGFQWHATLRWEHGLHIVALDSNNADRLWEGYEQRVGSIPGRFSADAGKFKVPAKEQAELRAWGNRELVRRGSVSYSESPHTLVLLV